MRFRRRAGTLIGMVVSSYPVTWVTDGGPTRSGKAEVRARALRLDAASEPAQEIPYEEVTASYVASGAERLDGRPTLVVRRGDEPPVRIAGVAGFGLVGELAERLADLRRGHSQARRRIVVVLPLRDGVADDVEALLDRGPPFDPAAIGLRSHDVFLTDREAIFTFDPADDAAVDRLLSHEGVWEAAASWGQYVAGPARVADEAFAWSRSTLTANAS